MPRIIILLATELLLINVSAACDLDANKVSATMGVKATTTEDGVVRVGWPRTDVKVTVDGLALRPFAGLGSWAAFTRTEHGGMVMGDTVLFEDEVNPAIDAAFSSGLQVTGLHNHFFFDRPKVYFMHIGGDGCPHDLAMGVRAIWDAIKKVRAANPEPKASFAGPVPTYGKLNAEEIIAAVGEKGQLQDDVFKITIGRPAEMGGMKFSGSMGLTTWAAFVGGDESAIVDGDFAMTAAEVQPVLKSLRKSGINIVALHNHMVGEHPAYYFVHFWGKGRATDLAQGFRHALDSQRSVSVAGLEQTK